MKRILDAIARYARAYEGLEELQDRIHLSVGDQKTGVIGEFYGKLYAQTKYPTAKVTYARPSTTSHDLVVKRRGRRPQKIQVKTVSEFSETKRLSPLHPGWDELYLMRLDRKLKPVGFWVIERDHREEWMKKPLKHRTMPEHDQSRSGSVEFRGRASKLAELNVALREARK